MENITPSAPPTGLTQLPPETKERIKHIVLNLLPKDESSWFTPLYLYQGFWSSPALIEGDILSHEYSKAQPSDILVCSSMKCGTTWLKALTFAIVTHHRYDSSTTTPLLRKLPHDCVPTLLALTVKDEVREPGLPLISTHAPYHGLPKSALELGCKIVYICRDPKDAFVSMFHLFDKWFPNKQLAIDKAFDSFCLGKSMYGPFWDHVLGYWKASQDRPKDVLFLRYQDMKKDTASNVKRLAEFMGYPFSPDEEKQGAVHDIIELCSFENMSNLDVNKNGIFHPKLDVVIENKTFFRKGKVGDWKNWLTPEMAQRLDNIMEEKLGGSGLTFHYNY